MSGDAKHDKRKLGKIQLQRLLVPAAPRGEEPPSSAMRKKDPGPPAPAAAPLVDLAQVIIAIAALEIIPRPAAEAQRVLPLEVSDAQVLLAMADPGDPRVIDEIGFVTGKAVSARAADPAALATAIQEAYDAAEKGAMEYRGPRARRR